MRRLRSIGLIETLRDRHIGHMKSGMEFDLAEYVKLSDLGERWVRRINQIEKSEGEAEENNKNA